MPIAATVVGGGLVGSLLSCYLAKRGFEVDVFEMRGDLRKQTHLRGKSINLALSERGLHALCKLNLDQQVIQQLSIPMYGRLIHDSNGRCRPIAYGQNGQCIYSVSRRKLNELLLDYAERQTNVRLHFGHKLVNADFDRGECVFDVSNCCDQTNDAKDNTDADDHNHDQDDNRLKDDERKKNRSLLRSYPSRVIFGADGAHSAIRAHAMRQERIDFNQQYIDHGYLELTIPPKQQMNEQESSTEFAMPPNYLHIWPRGRFMMIALPNADHSFTLTLFMPFAMFAAIQNELQLRTFFERHFKDAIDLIGWKELHRTYFSTRPSTLISINCRPMHLRGRCLLIGDAAHAMVPFFGQGMNCGFEDCIVLDRLLDAYPNVESINFERLFSDYSADRTINCTVICQLAMHNYVEMRDLVNSLSFLVRRKLDLALNRWLGKRWLPPYSMVTFSRLPYKECLRKSRLQDRIVLGTTVTASLATILAITFALKGKV